MTVYIPFIFSLFVLWSDYVLRWNAGQLEIFILLAMFLIAFFQSFRLGVVHALCLAAFLIWSQGVKPSEAFFLVAAAAIFLLTTKFRGEHESITEELKRDQHMRSLGKLSAMLAHEIRNPLTALSGSIEFLEERSRAHASKDDQKLFQIMKKEVGRLQNLVTDFLDFSKANEKAEIRLDLSKLLQDWVQFFQLQKTAELHAEIDDDIFVMGVEDRLQQVVINLLKNAAEAADATKKELPLIEVTLSENETGAKLQVCDHGRGIEPERIGNLFEPFQTTKNKGTGLGLAITKRILDFHRAKISVESRVGNGTTMTVQFLKAEEKV